MTDNNNHTGLEALERLLQDGQPTGEPLLDDLAATTPAARPAFQQQLEQQLVKTIRARSATEGDDTMQVTTLHPDEQMRKRQQRSLPVTLVAAVVLLFLGMGAVYMMTGPEVPGMFGAVSEDDETATAIWATEANLKSTVAADMTLVAQNQGHTATPFPPTEPPPAVSGLDQTSTAIIARASQQAATHFAATMVPPQATVVRPDAETGTICQIVDPNGTAVIHSRPGGGETAGTLPADTRIEVTTVVTEATTGATWLHVEFERMGQHVSGWVRESDVRVLAICFYEDRDYALLNGQPVPTATPVGGVSPLAVPPSQLLDATHTPVPTLPPTLTFTPTPTAYRMLDPVQVRVGDAEELDLEALVGRHVDLFIAAGSEDDPVIVPVARAVPVLEIVEVPMPNDTRYVFIEVLILPRSEEQAELLAGLAETNMEMKVEPVD